MIGPKKIKHLNSKSLTIVEPLRLFITGTTGVGKSYLVKILTTFLTNIFNLYSGTPGKRKVLLFGPTGVAALNIDGTTIHAGLGINPNFNSYTLGKLSEALKTKLRFEYSELVAIITDKISTVSNVRLLQIHKRLCEIFGCSEAISFAGKTFC